MVHLKRSKKDIWKWETKVKKAAGLQIYVAGQQVYVEGQQVYVAGWQVYLTS
jgi:hypothetical protein